MKKVFSLSIKSSGPSFLLIKLNHFHQPFIYQNIKHLRQSKLETKPKKSALLFMSPQNYPFCLQKTNQNKFKQKKLQK